MTTSRAPSAPAPCRSLRHGPTEPQTSPGRRRARRVQGPRVVPRLLAGLAAWLMAASGSAQILTLEDIEARAQRERPELIERQASIERARAELMVVQARTGPTLGARAEAGLAPGGELVEVTDNDGDEYLVAGSRPLGRADALIPQPRYAAVFAGKVTLLDFGRTAQGVRAAEAAVGAERAALVQAKVEVVESARSAYLAWLEAHQSLELARRDAEVTRARAVSVAALIEEGARAATDLTLAKYEQQLAELRQTRAERASGAALLALAASIQSELPPNAVPDLDVLEATAAPTSTAGAAAPASSAPIDAQPAPGAQPSPGANIERDPTVTALELQHRAALSAARAADRVGSPVLEAAGELGIQGQDINVFPVYRAAVTLTVPLWDGGQSAAQAAVHRAEARGLEARLRAVERALRTQQLAAREHLAAAQRELATSLALLQTAEALLAEAEEHYRAGSDTLERVLSAQRSLVAARREVLTAKLENARARLELTPVQVAP